MNFEGGLSDILFDSESFAYDPRNCTALSAALKAAKGPWRVLAGHRPISIDKDGGPLEHGEPGFDYAQWVEGAIEESGAPNSSRAGRSRPTAIRAT